MKIITENGEIKETNARMSIGKVFEGKELFAGSIIEFVDARGFKNKGTIVYNDVYASFQISVHSEKLQRSFFYFFSKIEIINLVRQ